MFAFNDIMDNGGNIQSSASAGVSHLGSLFNLSRNGITEPLKRIVTNGQSRSRGGSMDPLFDEIESAQWDEVAEATQYLADAVNGNWDFAVLIADALEGADNDRSRRLVASSVLRLLATYEFVEPFEPMWGFSWDVLEKIVGSTVNSRIEDLLPEEWCESVGIPAEKGDWIALLKYPADRPQELIRPTQLDAGDCPYHFPSPVDFQDGRICGFPVWLAHPTDVGRTQLLEEYIHQKVSVQFDEVLTVKQVTRSTPADGGIIDTWRNNHWMALRSVSADIEDWMPQANTI